METLVTVVHVAVCVFLIIVVLLQTGKGAEIGAVLGGAGSQTLFGGSGGATFLSKLTVWAAVVFMITNLGLTYMHSSQSSASVMDSSRTPGAPAGVTGATRRATDTPAATAPVPASEESPQ